MRINRLDGVRAVAILLVMAYHHRSISFIGWGGVDLFFVLSGLLITRILRASAGRETYWSRFYLKRAVRILPPLLLFLAMGLVLSRHVNLLSYAGYALFLGDLLNITPWRSALLMALWSLAVEEHFYMLWPVAVRFFSRRRLLAALALVLLLEPVLRGAATPWIRTYEVIYYLTPFRLDGLAAGSLLALLTEDPAAEAWLRQWSVAGFALTLLAYSGLLELVPQFRLYQNSSVFNSIGYSLMAAICFFFVAWVLLCPSSGAGRVLASRPLVYLGRISYGVYLFEGVVDPATMKLFHIPFDQSNASLLHMLLPLDAAIAIAMAAVSFSFYESPLLRWGNRVAERMQTARGESPGSEQGDAVRSPV